jgi:23S rRNA (uridine2552-2'-O)-methyltransferase
MRRNIFTKVKTAKGRKKSSTNWLQRHINDPFVKEAKYLGYRSRATFKIIEIDEKFKIFSQGKTIADLGSSPGGWSQIVSSKVGLGKIFAVDLLPMDSINGVSFIQGDFNDPNIQNKLTKNLADSDGKFDIIMSDMAENTCGDKKTDHLRMINILESILDFSLKFLKDDGCIIAKSFQGGSSFDFFNEIKKHFSSVQNFKPKSSRKESSETYIVAQNFNLKSK